MKAIQIAIPELISLVGVIEHAQERIAQLSDADGGTIARASGTALVPSLYARAGLALVKGVDSIPLLADEVGLLEAAVINLESYQGNEVVLCAGYQLLNDFANRDDDSYPLCSVHGILIFAGDAEDPASDPAKPSLM
ncbi:hypothetical protein OG241_18120 [Streptomyces sp. NBC_01390]|uniref:hypothetical protein n=1 Tax=Streptomyces sp. NBC_01390 TaxID=2903850 RepID=UPI0032495A73